MGDELNGGTRGTVITKRWTEWKSELDPISENIPEALRPVRNESEPGQAVS